MRIKNGTARWAVPFYRKERKKVRVLLVGKTVLRHAVHKIEGHPAGRVGGLVGAAGLG